MKTMMKIIRNNRKLYLICVNVFNKVHGIGMHFSPKLVTEFDFKQKTGYQLHIDDPHTFNEKIQWFKLYYHNPILTQCADKVAVREYIKKSIGAQYLVPIYAIFDNVEDIDISKFPMKFVLKPNHSSGKVIICQDKNSMDWSLELKRMKKWLKENYYYENGEWAYKEIKPKIICEELLEGEIIDYKFMCFHGVPKLLFTCSERETAMKVTFFDLQFNRLPFIRKYPASTRTIKKPIHFHEMIELSKVLSSQFDFVRVDFYENKGKIFFGELTFYPGNGMEWFEPKEWDRKLGDYFDLSKVNMKYVVK